MRSTATGVRTNSPPPHRRPVDPYSRPSDPYSGHDPYQVKSKEPKNNPSSTMWRPSELSRDVRAQLAATAAPSGMLVDGATAQTPSAAAAKLLVDEHLRRVQESQRNGGLAPNGSLSGSPNSSMTNFNNHKQPSQTGAANAAAARRAAMNAAGRANAPSTARIAAPSSAKSPATPSGGFGKAATDRAGDARRDPSVVVRAGQHPVSPAFTPNPYKDRSDPYRKAPRSNRSAAASSSAPAPSEPKSLPWWVKMGRAIGETSHRVYDRLRVQPNYGEEEKAAKPDAERTPAKSPAARKAYIFQKAALMLMRPAVMWAFAEWQRRAKATSQAKKLRSARASPKKKRNAMYDRALRSPTNTASPEKSPEKTAASGWGSRSGSPGRGGSPVRSARSRSPSARTMSKEEEAAATRELAAARSELQELPAEERGLSPLINEAGEKCRHLGQLEAARNLFSEALHARREKLGEEHPMTLISQNHLGLLLLQMGGDNMEEAYDLLKRQVDTRRWNQGKKHPETLTAVHNLASYYKEKRELDTAEKLYNEVLEGRREELGKTHPDTLTSLNNLAQCYFAMGRVLEAEPLMIECSKSAKKSLGREHNHSKIFARNLADLRRHPMYARLKKQAGMEVDDYAY